MIKSDITRKAKKPKKPRISLGTKQKVFPFTESELLENMTPNSAHADILAKPIKFITEAESGMIDGFC